MQDHPPEEDMIRFYQLMEGGMLPQRADRSAGGLIPTRAFRFCEQITTASAFGWYVFPPVGFKLLWTGTQILWSHDGDRELRPLVRDHLPGFSDAFDAGCPEELRGMAPPFLGVLPEPGVVQIWSGLMVRTRPDISLLVRAPANFPKWGPYEYYEGILETDRWFGPLFNNIRITQTNVEIYFDPTMPIFQLQPVHRDLYLSNEMNKMGACIGTAGFGPQEWADFAKHMGNGLFAPRKPMGHDATEVRRRRKAGPD